MTKVVVDIAALKKEIADLKKEMAKDRTDYARGYKNGIDDALKVLKS